MRDHTQAELLRSMVGFISRLQDPNREKDLARSRRRAKNKVARKSRRVNRG